MLFAIGIQIYSTSTFLFLCFWLPIFPMLPFTKKLFTTNGPTLMDMFVLKQISKGRISSIWVVNNMLYVLFSTISGDFKVSGRNFTIILGSSNLPHTKTYETNNYLQFITFTPQSRLILIMENSCTPLLDT